MDVNVANSEWSNGCESGWTIYLEESYITRNDNVSYHPSQSYRLKSPQNDNDDDEDLSMVSDASSGPPHFLVQEDDQQSYNPCCYSTNSEKSSKKSAKKTSKQHKKVSSRHNKQHQHHQQQYHHLDDTASSPVISTNSQIYANPSNIGFSQSYSTTHFEGNSSYNNHYAFWQSSHVQDTDYSSVPGQLSGRGWE